MQNKRPKIRREAAPKGLASRPICVKIEYVKNKLITQDQFKVYERNGQLVFALNSEFVLPENAPVRLTSEQLEELNYEKLYCALYYRVVVFRAPLQRLCYTVRDAVDWFIAPTARRFRIGSNHSPLQVC